MAANRETIHITDPVATTAGPNGDGTYQFALAPTGEGGRGYTLETRGWQPGDPATPWRIPLHDLSGGMGTSRLIGNKNTFTPTRTDQAESTYPGLIVAPGFRSGVTGLEATAVKIVQFNSEVFVIGGRYVDKITSGHTRTQDKDFGVGKSAVDACIFNNELVVAMGESEKLYTRNTSGTWTQATDNTFAIALGVAGDRLWRAADTNQISSCSTAPRTLASWTPADPNEYVVGDTSFAVRQIIDYGGVPWCIKNDGAYQPDPTAKFRNQTPQMAKYPSADSGRWAWTGWGYLWVPVAGGILRIGRGSSVQSGPETAMVDSLTFKVRSGVEWRGAMYLLCQMDNSTGRTDKAIIKMLRSEQGGYTYHLWSIDGTTNQGAAREAFITVNSFDASVAPELATVSSDRTSYDYYKFSLFAGREIDDSAFRFGTDFAFHSGDFSPGDDMGVIHVLQGCELVARLDTANSALVTLTAYSDYGSDAGQTSTLSSTQEGGGVAGCSGSATNPAVIERFVRYATATSGGFEGYAFNIWMSCSASGTITGKTRPEIRELWAFGFSRPAQLDVISVGIVADENARVGGRRMGMGRAEIVRVFRAWKKATTVLTLKIPDYEVGRTTRFLVTDVRETEAYATVGAGVNASASSMVMVELTRLDYAGAYASA